MKLQPQFLSYICTSHNPRSPKGAMVIWVRTDLLQKTRMEDKNIQEGAKIVKVENVEKKRKRKRLKRSWGRRCQPRTSLCRCEISLTVKYELLSFQENTLSKYFNYCTCFEEQIKVCTCVQAEIVLVRHP